MSALLLLASLPLSQAPGNEWIAFDRDDRRLVADPALGHDDPAEKDFAWGDLDRDGWTDLVVVRRGPWDQVVPMPNVLFMNEGGVLVDRTVEYASTADVPGDTGFLTPTNDTDVAIADVDADGWPDVITATRRSSGPEHVQDPRVYRNLGADASGQWLGLRFEDARIPMLTGLPRGFGAVTAGDVSGDGFVDLYLGHYLHGASADVLYINDGTGHFVDESNLRMTFEMLSSIKTVAAVIADLNGDGTADVVRDEGIGQFSPLGTSYNGDPSAGYFGFYEQVSTSNPYYVEVGDLNRDGRPELVVTSDFADFVLYNQGNDPAGHVDWSFRVDFEFVAGDDEGFGGNSWIADIDGDGFQDVVITGVDTEIVSCAQPTHVYHNRGGAPGAQVTLIEESELDAPEGWKGAPGFDPAMMQGAHDVALFDLDLDGDLDFILGRCVGTRVWMNVDQAFTAYCSGDGSGTACPCGNASDPGRGCENSTGAGALLWAEGTAHVAPDDLEFGAASLPVGQIGLLFAGEDALNSGAGFTFGDGLRCAGTNAVRLGTALSDGDGLAAWGPGLRPLGGWTAGDLRRFQVWYRDPAGGPCGSGFNLTNAMQVGFRP